MHEQVDWFLQGRDWDEVPGGIDEKAAPFKLGLVFYCYGKSANEEGLVLVCFEELGECFEAAEETGEVTRDELPSVVGPQ